MISFPKNSLVLKDGCPSGEYLMNLYLTDCTMISSIPVILHFLKPFLHLVIMNLMIYLVKQGFQVKMPSTNFIILPTIQIAVCTTSWSSSGKQPSGIRHLSF